MKIEDLLRYGYLPKELPPCFTSESFSINATAIYQNFYSNLQSGKMPKQYFNSTPIRFSLPKVGLIRKNISIPNPFHFYRLSELIFNNITQIETHINKSKISSSKPDFTNVGKKRCFESKDQFGDFFDKCLSESVGAKYQIKTDISKYYGSIYTHSISWALHGKQVSKQNIGNNSLLGNQLDNFVRYCQEGQSIGIAIGPDTSLVISEIIGAAIDLDIQKKFPNVKGARWIDDMYLYVESHEEADKLFKYIQNKFREYQLEPNEKKTSILPQPFLFQKKWTTDLKRFEFKNNTEKQEQDSIRNFFNLVNRLAIDEPEEWILKFALGRLRNFKVKHKSNWDLFENFICNTYKADPAVVQSFLAILLSHKGLVNINKLEKTILSVLSDSMHRGKNYEVLWSIWCLLSFGINLNGQTVLEIMKGENFLAKTLIYEHYRAAANVNALNILNNFNPTSFFMDDWLYVYQIYKDQTNNLQIDGYEFFDLLKHNNVSFVDLTKQIDFETHYDVEDDVISGT